VIVLVNLTVRYNYCEVTSHLDRWWPRRVVHSADSMTADPALTVATHFVVVWTVRKLILLFVVRVKWW